MIIILSRWNSLGKTVYMEKNHPTSVISHLRCGEIYLGRMSPFSYINDLSLESVRHHPAGIAIQ